MGTVGQDFGDYRAWLEAQGVDTSLVRAYMDDFTATFTVITDEEQNQIAGFHGGAMFRAHELTFHDLDPASIDLVIISPNDPVAMLKYAAECRELSIRFIFDPSQQLPWLDGPQLDLNPPGPWRTGMIWDETRGVQHWLYPAVPKGEWVDETMAPPALKFLHSDDPTSWNELEINAIGTRVKAVLNGDLVTYYDGAGVLNDATHRARQVGERGHLALQIHTGDRLRIRFKYLQIREM
jgi:hypothetical protein